MTRLTVKEAAEYLRVSVGTLERWRTTGGGPRYIKFARRVFYDRGDLDRWIESRKQASTADLPELRGRQRSHVGR
jgi:excisionase family DNA binding protein